MTDTAQPLYDLAPLLRLMLLGVVIALGPLLWVWLRNRGSTPVRHLQALTVLTLFLTFDLVMFGAFTRLTDSGLGCPDWPGCYGNASPVGARAEISAAQEAMPTGPVTHGKAWVEMIHRYLATGVGVLIIALTVGAWRQQRAARRGQGPAPALSPWWPTFTLFWVCLQGAFGALTVTMKLFPAIVTLHLIGGIVLLALLCVQAVRQTLSAQARALVALPGGLRALLWATTALVSAQIVLGGWVSTNYAVLACTTFPACQGSWWPDMAFAQGFQIWRPLGLLQDGSHISFAGLTAIHYVHRLAAYVVIGALALLVWRLRRAGALRDPARWLAGLTLLQFATGLSNVVLDWPLVAAVLHTGGAAALIVVLTWALAASRRGPVTGTAGVDKVPHPPHGGAEAAKIPV
ncbi:COX15/CtaA family protein [Paracidovorax wautersii]|uniref:Cytochrome c oxidase assembly protein subunit 15 n=1 Tax=Paracidovorax wautersii TaxID=1177982 RepID=A0ABU1I663_9BURK|nr:COX15/CtaA family protein [Paracidovorax wautersii]MDR6212697.1 cytochrome c oxidase assembly protein subunit 15 [Paracidovorax wautersii]